MAGLGRPRCGWTSVVLGSSFFWVCLVSAWAQFGGPTLIQSDISPEQGLLNQLPRETQLLVELGHAREQFKSGDYEAAIDTLQPLLDLGEDYFEVEDQRPTGSLLDRIESLLWSMPAEAIETYRRRYEPLAEKQLETARKSLDFAELLEITRAYPLTRAARSATRLAGDLAFDQGEPATAARLWERVLLHLEPGPERTELLLRTARAWTQSGQPDSASKQLEELSSLAQSGPLVEEGRNITPPPKPDSEWLNKVFGPVMPLIPQRVGDWKMAGGHPRRWGSGEPVSPLFRGAWTAPLIDQYDTFFAPGRETEFLTFLKEIERKYQQNDPFDATKTTPLVIGAPLVVGNTAVVQGLGSVKALDTRTGEIRWSGVVQDETFLYWAWRNYQSLDTDQLHNRLVEVYFGQRAWLNQTGAALSSDGRQVYSISGTGMIGAHKRNMFMRAGAVPPPQELTPPRENRLLSYDLATGLLKWECGGPATAAPLSPDETRTSGAVRLPGAYFLGAPLPVDGVLFTLAEERGQIRLFAINPDSGEAHWSLPLLNPESGIDFDESRRLFGLSPAYAGGLLICPTGEGVVVAVDPLLGRVVWTNQYHYTPRVTNPQNFAMMGFRRGGLQNESLLINLIRQRRWLDNTPILTPGRVLLPAAECNKLICLKSETGEKLWEIPRGDSLYVAACTPRHCLIVGERTVQSFNLSDGKFRWSQEIPSPAGRGVVSGDHYLLPVSSNEILAIEMKSGRIVSRSELPTTLHAGSLVSSQGQLLMQTTSEIIGYRPLSEVSSEIARDLNNPATQSRAFAEQGELLLFQGKDTEAIELLRKSLVLQESPATRKLLVWSLLEKLKADYSGSQSLVEELRKTVTDPEQKRLLSQILAEGLEKSNESVAAFREYLELVSTVGRNDLLQSVAFDHQIRNDRWLRGRLTRLFSLASDAQRQEMVTAIESTVAPLDTPRKQMFARVLGIDLAPDLHLQLALSNQLEPFLAQRVLWTLSESPQLQLRGPAVARLIRNQLALNRYVSLNPLLAHLERDLAAVECEEGVTGKQVLENLNSDKKIGPLLLALKKTADPPEIQGQATMGILPQREVLRVLGARRGPLANSLFTLETSPSQDISWTDITGRTRPMLRLSNLQNPNIRPIRYVQSDPQLALLVYRDSFAVMSPFEANSHQYMPRLQGMLADGSPGTTLFRSRAPDIKQGVRDYIFPTANNSYQGNVGPLTFDTLCYVTGSELTAIIPYEKESKIAWKRTAVTPGSEICADSEYVVLIPPLLGKLVVLRAADGSKVAERDMPKDRVERQRADWGRLFLVRREVAAEGAMPARTTWAMYDPAFDRDAWSITLAAGTLWGPVNGEEIGLLEPDGTFHLLDDQTGREQWKATIPMPAVPVKEFSVHVDDERVFVHTAYPPSENQPAISEPAILGRDSSIRVNGHAVALDRLDGSVRWSRPIEQQLFRPQLPAGGGVLAYSTLRKQQPATPAGEYATEITFLSRSTGEPLFTEKYPGASVGEGWRRQPDGSLHLLVGGHEFHLKWKSPPGVSNEPPEQSEPQPDGSQGPIKLQ